MKLSLNLLIIISLLASCEQKTNDLKKGKLNGNVHIVIERTFEPIEKFGVIEKDSFLYKYVYTYNQTGNEEKFSSYDTDTTKPLLETTSSYNEEDKLLERTSRFKNEVKLRKETCEYDTKGILIAVSEYNGSEMDIKRLFKYDEKGNIIESRTYSSDGLRLIQKVSMDYDQKGNILKTWEDDGGSSYKYDENGNQIEQDMYNEKGELYEKVTNKYKIFDEEGNWTKETVFRRGQVQLVRERQIIYY